MSTDKIIERITEIARELSKNGEKMTRADLAFNLKKLGIDADSSKISKFIWECLTKNDEKSADGKSIYESFVNNEKTRTVIEEYKLPAILDSDVKSDEWFKTFDSNTVTVSSVLDELGKLVSGNFKEELIKQTSNIVNTISGTSAIKSVQSDAQKIFQQYSELTSSYSNAKTSINSLVDDFSSIRENIVDIYRRNSLILVDIFGDKIKAQMPELFDFNSIQWLDVESMHNKIQLEYNTFSTKCGNLIGEVSDSFKNSLGLLTTGISMKKVPAENVGGMNKTTALVIAGWSFVSHWLEVADKTAKIKSEALLMKNSIMKDSAEIKADEMRLLEIFKTINDIFIPKARVFKRYAPEIFDSETKKLIENLYSSPNAKKLREKREEILFELHELDSIISDGQFNVEFYENHIKECNETLSGMESQYKSAKSLMPQKPSAIKNVFTFGMAKKQYNREVYDWNKDYSSVVSIYEDLTASSYVEKDELIEQKKKLGENKIKYEKLKRELSESSEKMLKEVASSDELKKKVAENIEDIVKLLKLAKEIASEKLEDRLLKVQSIGSQNTEVAVQSLKEVELPAEMKNFVDKFKKDLATSIKKEIDDEIKDSLGSSPENSAVAAEISAKVIGTGVNLCESLSKLQQMYSSLSVSKDYYESELNRMQKEFRENVKKLDDKANVLNEIFKEINTSSDNENLKKALLSLLCSDGNSMSSSDFSEFLGSSKKIEI